MHDTPSTDTYYSEAEEVIADFLGDGWTDGEEWQGISSTLTTSWAGLGHAGFKLATEGE